MTSQANTPASPWAKGSVPTILCFMAIIGWAITGSTEVLIIAHIWGAAMLMQAKG